MDPMGHYKSKSSATSPVAYWIPLTWESLCFFPTSIGNFEHDHLPRTSMMNSQNQNMLNITTEIRNGFIIVWFWVPVISVNSLAGEKTAKKTIGNYKLHTPTHPNTFGGFFIWIPKHHSPEKVFRGSKHLRTRYFGDFRCPGDWNKHTKLSPMEHGPGFVCVFSSSLKATQNFKVTSGNITQMPETNSSHLKIGIFPKRKESSSSLPAIKFQGFSWG